MWRNIVRDTTAISTTKSVRWRRSSDRSCSNGLILLLIEWVARLTEGRWSVNSHRRQSTCIRASVIISLTSKTIQIGILLWSSRTHDHRLLGRTTNGSLVFVLGLIERKERQRDRQMLGSNSRPMHKNYWGQTIFESSAHQPSQEDAMERIHEDCYSIVVERFAANNIPPEQLTLIDLFEPPSAPNSYAESRYYEERSVL